MQIVWLKEFILQWPSLIEGNNLNKYFSQLESSKNQQLMKIIWNGCNTGVNQKFCNILVYATY